MNNAHYIIFHPERQEVKVNATSLINNQHKINWSGKIFVDPLNAGNEDPFVFNHPWLYSFCHASQLRRNKNRKGSFLQKDSILLFADCQQAEKEILQFDTVFIIDECQQWDKNPLNLPEKYKYLKNDFNSLLWKRHFKFPFDGIHKTVSFTYEASLWEPESNLFSFLPLDQEHNRVCIPFKKLPNEISLKLKKRIKGKYPVLFDDEEIKYIHKLIYELSVIKVVQNIVIKDSILSKSKSC